MDWRRTLPLGLLLLNGWIAIGFVPAHLLGPLSLVLFGGLTVVGLLAGLAVKGRPRETEQNVLAVLLIVVLFVAVGVSSVMRLAPQVFDGEGAELLVFPVWAVASGYTAGRFWSVPSARRPVGEEKWGSQAPAPEAESQRKPGGPT